MPARSHQIDRYFFSTTSRKKYEMDLSTKSVLHRLMRADCSLIVLNTTIDSIAILFPLGVFSKKTIEKKSPRRIFKFSCLFFFKIALPARLR